MDLVYHRDDNCATMRYFKEIREVLPGNLIDPKIFYRYANNKGTDVLRNIFKTRLCLSCLTDYREGKERYERKNYQYL